MFAIHIYIHLCSLHHFRHNSLPMMGLTSVMPQGMAKPCKGGQTRSNFATQSWRATLAVQPLQVMVRHWVGCVAGLHAIVARQSCFVSATPPMAAITIPSARLNGSS